jgi:hypothetical protein
VITTASGVGRFSDPHLPLSYQLMFAQMVIVSAAVCSLALAALVTERRTAEEHQRLLISQLDHRVKNSLALMQAVVERSQVSARTIGDFVASLGGRIKSMARTQSKLSTGRWQGLCLEGVIKDELSPYHTAGSDAVVAICRPVEGNFQPLGAGAQGMLQQRAGHRLARLFAADQRAPRQQGIAHQGVSDDDVQFSAEAAFARQNAGDRRQQHWKIGWRRELGHLARVPAVTGPMLDDDAPGMDQQAQAIKPRR